MGHSKNIFMEERLVSNCCGAFDEVWDYKGAHVSDLGVCPLCYERCKWITFSQREEEMKLEILTGKKDTNE